jgi:hypothetical protein
MWGTRVHNAANSLAFASVWFAATKQSMRHAPTGLLRCARNDDAD